MNEKLLIRTIAAELLVKIYLESNSSLQATISTQEIINKYDKITVQKAGQYLLKKQLATSGRTLEENWTVTITYQGIDWVEDWHTTK